MTLTSEVHFVRFHPEIVSCFLSRGKIKYVTLGMRLCEKTLKLFIGIPLKFTFSVISLKLLGLQNFRKIRLSFEKNPVAPWG